MLFVFSLRVSAGKIVLPSVSVHTNYSCGHHLCVCVLITCFSRKHRAPISIILAVCAVMYQWPCKLYVWHYNKQIWRPPWWRQHSTAYSPPSQRSLTSLAPFTLRREVTVTCSAHRLNRVTGHIGHRLHMHADHVFKSQSRYEYLHLSVFTCEDRRMWIAHQTIKPSVRHSCFILIGF
jgi:hypothetical protein